MAFVIPIAVAIATPTVFTIAAAALGVVGALSGNATLSKIAGLVGLAGGISSLANAAGEAGSAASAAGDAAGAVSPAAGEAAGQAMYDAGQAVQSGADVAGQAVDTASRASDVGGSVAQEAGAPDAASQAIPGAGPIQTPAQAVGASSSDVGRGLIEGGIQQPSQLAAVSPGPVAPSAPSVDTPGIHDFYGTTTENAGIGNAATSAVTAEDNSLGGIIGRIFKSDFLKGDATKAALVKAGGEFIAKGFGRNPQLEAVDVARQRLAAEQAELARRNAAQSNIGQVNLNQRVNPNATLLQNGTYVPISIANRMRIP